MYSDYNPNETPIPTTIMRPPPPIKVDKLNIDEIPPESLEYNPVEIPVYNEYSVLPDSIKVDKGVAPTGENDSIAKKWINTPDFLPPTIRITKEDDEDTGICQYAIDPAFSIEIGHYLIEKICSAKGGCGHYFKNKHTGNVYWKAGHVIHRILKKHGYSHPHFDKFENWEEEQRRIAELQYAELEARREKERLELEKTIEHQPRVGDSRNWKR